MNKIKLGIISDINYIESPAYSSYYYASKNIFESVKLISNKDDLTNVDVLLCGNDHYANHLKVWRNVEFIEKCNKLKIPFFVHTVEHIKSPAYPHNIQIQNDLEKFQLLNQRCWDIEDSLDKKRNIARVLLSKNFYNFNQCEKKKNKIIFIGKLYDNRIKLFNSLSKYIDIEVFNRGSLENNSYNYFLSKLAQYKYIISPKSLYVNGIPGRFYESLWVNSIPIQEIYENTLDFYNIEKNIEDCIFFKYTDELIEKLLNQKNTKPNLPKLFLEDELISFFNEFGIKI